jgi:hypothetical protein
MSLHYWQHRKPALLAVMATTMQPLCAHVWTPPARSAGNQFEGLT